MGQECIGGEEYHRCSHDDPNNSTTISWFPNTGERKGPSETMQSNPLTVHAVEEVEARRGGGLAGMPRDVVANPDVGVRPPNVGAFMQYTFMEHQLCVQHK